MPTPTYDLIASNVLTSSASSVTFSSIPATYRDLIIVGTIVDDGANFSPFTFLTFNGDSGANYSVVRMTGNGTSAISNSSTGQNYIFLTDGATPTNDATLFIAQVMDYSATDKHKTVLNRSNLASTATNAQAGRWASTSAITSLTLDSSGGGRAFASGSTFYLYGIVS